MYKNIPVFYLPSATMVSPIFAALRNDVLISTLTPALATSIEMSANVPIMSTMVDVAPPCNVP